MTDGRVPRWTALLRESLAVLAAILVAFALDAWWEESQERRMMLEALDAVAVELERNVAEVNLALEYNEDRAALVGEMAAMSVDQVQALDEAGLLHFSDLPNYHIATLELGAATAFIEGGFLSVLDDRELRSEVAGLPRLQLELDEEANVVLEQSERLNVRVLDAMPLDAFRTPGGLNSPEATRALLRAAVTDEDTLRMFLGRTFFLSFLYAGELQRTRDRLQEVRARIADFRRG
jgi:hypothetical protein